jgi:predicted transcriptional regulator of viral defense system
VKPDLFNSPELVVFTTRDFARLADVSITAASRRLARLRQSNRSLVQLTRGIWANIAHPNFTVMACVPVLIGGEQGYVSFLTALHIHGAISQIPASIQVATTGHTRKLRTQIGTFDFLQLKPDMFAHGVEWSDSAKPFRIATLEKAVLDTFYISTRKNRRFAKLPELDLEEAGFSLRRYNALLKKHNLSQQIATAMASRLEAVTSISSHQHKRRQL